MTTSDIRHTEESILVAILALRKERDSKKLTVTDVAKRAGVSRNSIYKYYNYLLPVITDGKYSDRFKLVSKERLIHQEQINESQLAAELALKELDELRSSLEKKQESFKALILGEYMQNIIISQNSNHVENEMSAMQEQLSDRINDAKQLRLDKSRLTAKLSKLEDQLANYKSSGGKRVIRKLFAPDYRAANESYIESRNFSSWLIDKKTLTKHTIQLAFDYSIDSDAIVVVLTHYNADPDNLMKSHCVPEGKYTYINLAIPTATERKRYIADIKKKTCLPVYCIYAHTTSANSRWYRQTTKPDVPTEEIKHLDDNWQQPTINEGYKNLQISEVSYG